jgi:hypothetical protein
MGGAGKEPGGLRLQARKRSKGNTGDRGSIGHGLPFQGLSEALLISNEAVRNKLFSVRMSGSDGQLRPH